MISAEAPLLRTTPLRDKIPFRRWWRQLAQTVTGISLLSRFGPGPTTAICLGALSLIILGIVVRVAVYYQLPVLPGVAVTVLIHAVLAPFVYYNFEVIDELQRSQSELYRLSIVDSMTQTFNRRHFIDRLEQIFDDAVRFNLNFAVIIFDLDDFKQINDSFGHHAGDAVLAHVAKMCKAKSRSTDIFARYGGEEFAYILPNATAASAVEFAERIRACIAEETLIFHGEPIPVTMSAGVRAFSRSIPNISAMLGQADKALYAAKVTKNCVWLHV
ncbi:MAG: GGDEF domain-containing protein [Caldilineaceae bacterium]|nr:GGDEF domain-containing protein [Caldilineaceae bacterium]